MSPSFRRSIPCVSSSRARRGLTVFAFVALGSSALGCAAAKAPPAHTVSFRLRGQPGNASVTIDDQPIGPLETVQRRGIALPGGPHRITVEAPGYLPWDRIVSAESAPIALEVALIPIPE